MASNKFTIGRKKQIRFAGWLLLALLSIGIPTETQAKPKFTGISGHTMIHNSQLVRIDGLPVEPYPFGGLSLHVYSTETGESVAAVTSDSQGKFQIELPRGEYWVAADPLLESGEIVIGTYLTAPLPILVRVKQSHTTTVNLLYETNWL